MGGGAEKPPRYQMDERYDATLINADVDLDLICSQLVQSSARQFSFCLSGPPGTGKSAWARYLAQCLGMETLHKRASDLMSKWLGQSEKNIATAFAEARERDALLILDEADSFLADRRGAVRSWEVSQVNEMLTWMESHPLPFVCTTNLVESLDLASARRFTFKVRFDYLRTYQAESAFSNFFEKDAPAELGNLKTLTPSDFATVRRKASLLGQMGDASLLVKLLEEECRAKPDAPRPIGFMR
jgi:SpoVK/Ycf46/Vps4 family AAA+-type ATPase